MKDINKTSFEKQLQIVGNKSSFSSFNNTQIIQIEL